jgi:CRP/FNR family cyclic AMP-dependent transcriptional regulator
MNTPVLTIDERHNIEAGAWFSKLSQPLRKAILSRASVRRLADGAPLATRGSPAEEWCGVARGAVRVSSVSPVGQAGHADLRRARHLVRRHRAVRRPAAHPRCRCPWRHHPAGGAQARLQGPAGQHVELYDALLRLNCRRLRLMFHQFEDLNTRPLQARLAKQLLLLARATASLRATRSASACNWPRKTWRSCWVRRASASTRNSRASSATARARRTDPAGGAVARKAAGRCREVDTLNAVVSTASATEQDPHGALHRHPPRWPTATPSTSAHSKPTWASACPASPAR